jgi:Protein of unknown function (DUF4239)
MLSFKLDALILILTVAGSIAFMLAIDRLWPWEKRHVHNDLIGWHLSVLGTTYAVILGFMLYAVWTNFGAADLNVDLEANALRNVYRIAEGLPEPQHSELQKEARVYADAVVDQEWPEMSGGGLPEQSHAINRNMWQIVMSSKPTSPSETLAEDHILSELTSLTEHRRVRLLQSQSRIPSILWCVLIVGGILTIGSACLFGSASPRLHSLQVFAFSLLIVLALLATADINRPFQGSVHVSVYAFQRAQQNMND